MFLFERLTENLTNTSFVPCFYFFIVVALWYHHFTFTARQILLFQPFFSLVYIFQIKTIAFWSASLCM